MGKIPTSPFIAPLLDHACPSTYLLPDSVTIIFLALFEVFVDETCTIFNKQASNLNSFFLELLLLSVLPLFLHKVRDETFSFKVEISFFVLRSIAIFQG